MTKKLGRIIPFLLVAAMIITSAAFAGCGSGSADTGSGTAGGSEQQAPADKASDDVFGELPVVPTVMGEDVVSDGTYIFFTVHSDDDPYTLGPHDGIYRADISMGSPELLVRADCRSLFLDGDYLYFFNESSVYSGIFRVDKNGTTVEMIRNAESNASVNSVMLNGEELVFIQAGKLIIDEDPSTNLYDELKPDSGYVDSVRPCDNGFAFSVFDPKNNSRKLYMYDEELDGSVAALMDLSGFVVDGGSVYFFNKLPDQPEYEDNRKYEYELMRLDKDGEVTPTGITGRFGDDLYLYGDHLFYTKYTEEKDSGGSDEEITVSRPFCYDTGTGKEKAVIRDYFAGWDIRIKGIGAGWLFYDVYQFIDDDYEKQGTECVYLAEAGEPLELSAIAQEAKESEAFIVFQDMEKENLERVNEENERSAEEAQRQREEEAKNEPYGPGTSKLYLDADDSMTCYRLLRRDGTVEFQVLLAPGEETVQEFPSGRYTLKVASGETWISDEEAFGENGSYSSTDLYTFEPGGSYEITASTVGGFHREGWNQFVD